MSSEAALLATRSEFPTVDKGVHLISHSLGAVPKKARAYAMQFLDEWENDSINAWHEWLPAVRSLGDLVAGVLGVAPGTVAMLPNVSTVQSFVASCFAFPHFYTTDGELHRFMTELDAIRKEGPRAVPAGPAGY